jgi:hypothetical protein
MMCETCKQMNLSMNLLCVDDDDDIMTNNQVTRNNGSL